MLCCAELDAVYTHVTTDGMVMWPHIDILYVVLNWMQSTHTHATKTGMFRVLNHDTYGMSSNEIVVNDTDDVHASVLA